MAKRPKERSKSPESGSDSGSKKKERSKSPDSGSDSGSRKKARKRLSSGSSSGSGRSKKDDKSAAGSDAEDQVRILTNQKRKDEQIDALALDNIDFYSI